MEGGKAMGKDPGSLKMCGLEPLHQLRFFKEEIIFHF